MVALNDRNAARAAHPWLQRADSSASRGLVPGRAGKRVLIVEDDRDLQGALGALLESEGYAIELCANGKVALETLRSGTPADAILLDLHLPVMDGWEFRAAQRRDPAIARIPVVAISADESAQATAVHAEAYLRKPLLPRELVSAIEGVIAENERRQLAMRLVEAERLAAIGRMAAGVGHEINNPLAYVTLNIRTLYERVLGTSAAERWWSGSGLPDLPEMLKEVLEGLDRIGRIVANLRTLSRKEDDTLLRVNVEWILNRALATLDHQLGASVRVERVFANVPPFGGYPGKLMQLFLNLIANAIQAIEECPRADHVLRLETSVDGEHIQITIRDTGSGIRPEILARIFDPFFTTKPLGTGLGLAICRQLVADHDGVIQIESIPGSGSTVYVRLPRKAPALEATPRMNSAAAGATTRRARVLVVDDERFIRSSIGRSLGPQHDVVGVENVPAALDLLSRGESFDLILCDLILPRGNAGDLYDFLCEKAPEQVRSLVFMTGGAFTSQAAETVERAQLRVLVKPVSAQDLRSVVADALQ